MKNSVLACATFGALVLTAPLAASAFQHDGAMPMYPNATLDPKESSVTPAALAHGVPIVILTHDAVGKVDAWYGKNTHGCPRQAQGGSIKYACPGGSIMIYNKGGTQIALIPPMPSF